MSALCKRHTKRGSDEKSALGSSSGIVTPETRGQTETFSG
jgi:hypothetical protein